MNNILLLSYRKYAFTDESGKRVEGVQLNYLNGDIVKEGDRAGAFPLTVSCTSEVVADIREVPGRYRIDWRQKPGKNGRPTLCVNGLAFEAPFQMFEGFPD